MHLFISVLLNNSWYIVCLVFYSVMLWLLLMLLCVSFCLHLCVSLLLFVDFLSEKIAKITVFDSVICKTPDAPFNGRPFNRSALLCCLWLTDLSRLLLISFSWLTLLTYCNVFIVLLPPTPPWFVMLTVGGHRHPGCKWCRGSQTRWWSTVSDHCQLPKQRWTDEGHVYSVWVGQHQTAVCQSSVYSNAWSEGRPVRLRPVLQLCHLCQQLWFCVTDVGN